MSVNYEFVSRDFKNSEQVEMRAVFGESMFKLAERNDKVVALTADLGKSLRLDKMSRKYPQRYFNVGVAEQNMIGVAAGMASEGLIPFATSFAVFSPGRSWEQIRISVASMNNNVKIVGSHGGLSVGKNGMSHQALEDIAIMRVLPNMVIISPCDANQTEMAVQAIADYKGPVYLRFPRMASRNFSLKAEFEIGRSYVYREGGDISIFATGVFVWEALMLAEELSVQGVDSEVINLSTIKPLDRTTLIESARKTGKVVTWEDHQFVGGMGSAVCEELSQENVKIMRVGVEDKFGESGEPDELFEKYGISREKVKSKIIDFLKA